MGISYRSAEANDTEAVFKLLQKFNLPTEDLRSGLPHFVLAFDGKQLVGTAGVELTEGGGLLRSVAVDEAYQGRGIAAQLYSIIKDKVQSRSITALYLITNTADRYFGKIGFESIDRNEVPEAIRKTQQFSTICPSSAVVMRQILGL